MELAANGFVDFEDGVLGPVLAEIVWAVFDPAVENRFVAIVIVAASQNHLLLDPDQMVPERESGRLEGLDKSGEKRTRRHRGVTRGTGVRALGRERQRGAEKFMSFLGRKRIVDDAGLYLCALVQMPKRLVLGRDVINPIG